MAIHASHTFVLSDIHLADTEPADPRSPLWKKFKRPEFFSDHPFKNFLEFVQKQSTAPIELILNGDIFDFDSVMAMPKDHQKMPLSWVEKKRGLNPEEAKSRFKMKTIIETHHIWMDALRKFVSAGNRVIFVLGNHDLELHWPSVQQDLCARLGVVEFVEWFYISNQDTLIEHGNQYDPYSLCTNPINPFILKNGLTTLRLPFGNLAGKYLINGMGLINPHSTQSFIKSSVGEYLVFFYKYILKAQPFIFFSWFWGALYSLGVTLNEGFKPALTDPITFPNRVEAIAVKANSNSKVVLAMRELHAHPACFNPLQMLKELWLDRAILFLLVLFVSLEIYLFGNAVTRVSMYFFIVPFLLLMPAFIFYARSIRSGIKESLVESFVKMEVAARITNVKRTIHGHTHFATHCTINDIEHLNTGTWSPAFKDIECTEPYSLKCFAWLHPGHGSNHARVAELFEWKDTVAVKKAYEVNSEGLKQFQMSSI